MECADPFAMTCTNSHHHSPEWRTERLDILAEATAYTPQKCVEDWARDGYRCMANLTWKESLLNIRYGHIEQQTQFVWPCCIRAYDDKWRLFIFLLKFRVLFFWRLSPANHGICQWFELNMSLKVNGSPFFVGPCWAEFDIIFISTCTLRRKIHRQTLDAPRLVKSRRWQSKNIALLGKNWDASLDVQKMFLDFLAY